MKYYDLKKKWRYIKPHLKNKKLNKIIFKDVNEYQEMMGYPTKLKMGDYPYMVDGTDWHLSQKGRPPEYRNYTLACACHSLVRFNLKLARLVEPDSEWRIISSDRHSTVWDGNETIFEFNYYAFGIPASEAFKKATENVAIRLNEVNRAESCNAQVVESQEQIN